MRRHPLCLLLPALALALAACSDDELRLVSCEENQPDFDIEEVSVLDTAFSIKGGGDAVVLDANTAKIPEGAVWSVGSVEVLVAIPQEQGNGLNTGIPLTVQVWDGTRPDSVPWEVRQELDPAALTWETGDVTDPDSGEPFTVRRAWWKFDFTTVMPEAGMTAKRYLVGVRWDPQEKPLVGYSNYNRPCSLNWTDYDDGKGWVLNGTNSGNTCAWPMFRVGSRIVVQKTKCD